MRKRITYANVVATLALVFAMSGGALAANHYLISSTKQLSPKVFKALKGKTGATGKSGASGATGATGATGAAGATGPQGLAGAKGDPGTPGANGTARAFGVMASTGSMVAAKTKNLTASKIGTGVYCLTPSAASGVNAETVQPIVQTDFDDAPGSDQIAMTVNADTQDFAECPAGWVFVTDFYSGTEWKRGNTALTVIVP
jgi:hypothetical protein